MIKTTIKKLKNGLTMVLVEDKNKIKQQLF